ncbi:DUF4350 domain-containing protein [Hyunsoonleella pacifica]|uniref:DUF4350 domain-containing protein n=1 Tax=Hyunsoonleella pacifica TaxID=1080224 RepID=A0A4Q9FI77_9FLAO|nr:DUF4350 domain-containing protein [Hyunsoonleella pacifica]TBN13033.1 DUF4350 domain-containing protein [Hyunsoonleella pacifica]GGD27716.1 hypothetical protein GCM10011368_32150 [Hyunsoonleella pacifica]
MKKLLPVILVIIALIVVIALTFNVKQTRTIDWEESFNEKSNKPYGVSVLYKELPKLFKDYKLRTVYHQPSSYLTANSKNGYGDHEAKGNYIIIGNSDYLTEFSVEKLLEFVDTGNTLFISDYYFAQQLHDTLNIDVDFEYNLKNDSISYLSFQNKNLNAIKIDKNEGDYFFSSFDSINYTILGHSKTDKKRVNFIKVPFGKGVILLHTEPKAFTNYHILKGDRYHYVESVLSYLPDNDVYFDSYAKRQTPYGDAEEESNLSWFLDQLSFRWAWYTAIIFMILFMIFNAKRRQRIIKIIKPLQNTSLAFVKTISNLYIETKDYKNLIDKKITYFLEKVRTDFNLDTSVLNDEFIKKLAAKAGRKKEDVKQLVNYIKWLQTKDELSEQSLVKLNRFIEDFYAQ